MGSTGAGFRDDLCLITTQKSNLHLPVHRRGQEVSPSGEVLRFGILSIFAILTAAQRQVKVNFTAVSTMYKYTERRNGGAQGPPGKNIFTHLHSVCIYCCIY